MAYKTSHRIHVSNDITASFEEEIELFMEENEDICWITYGELNEWGDEDRSFTNKDKNMKMLSKKFDSIIFVLEYDPIMDYEMGQYTEYWLNGMVQRERAHVEIDEFDTCKLKEI